MILYVFCDSAFNFAFSNPFGLVVTVTGICFLRKFSMSKSVKYSV